MRANNVKYSFVERSIDITTRASAGHRRESFLLLKFLWKELLGRLHFFSMTSAVGEKLALNKCACHRKIVYIVKLAIQKKLAIKKTFHRNM